MTVKVAHDGNLRGIQAAAGLHEVAELPVSDKTGDQCEFLLQRMPVMCL
jgi:hypothetical protein